MLSQRLQKLILVTFHLLFLSLPFFFTWVNEELFEFPKMLLAYGFTLLIVGLWISRMIVEKKIILKQTTFDWPLLFFLIGQILATIFSIDPHTSVFGYYTRFHGGLLSTLTYIMLFYALVSNISLAQSKKLLLTIFIAALGVTFYAIPEHFGVSPSCLFITGKPDVACWIQDVQSRVFATFGQPNWLAAYAITLLPLGLTLTALSQKKIQKIFFGLTSLTLFLTLIFTQSRSGMSGFLISLFLLIPSLIWLRLQTPTPKTTLGLKNSFLILGTFIVIGLIFGTPFSSPQPLFSSTKKQTSSPDTSQTVQPTPAPAPLNRLEVGGTDSGEIRKIVWQGALAIWKRYPLFGSGVETFAYSYYQDRPLAHNQVSEWDFLYNKAHNELLNFLATTGIVGLGTYLLLFTWLSAVTGKIILDPKKQFSLEQKTLTLALLTGLLALSISNFFGFSTVMVSVLLFTFFGFIAQIDQQRLKKSAVVKKTTHKTQAISATKISATKVSQQTTSLSALQIVALGICGVGSLWLLNKVRQIWIADKTYAQGKTYLQAGQTFIGLENLQTAVQIRPGEALFHNQLADTYSQIALLLNQQNESTAAAEFKQAALDESALTLKLNSRQLNFYKTQARVLITLSSLEPELLTAAKKTLVAALELAPTDAKLMYNLALVEISLTETEAGRQTLEKTIQMKPNYEAARLTLGQQYEVTGKIAQAQEQYQYIQNFITTQNELVNAKLAEFKKSNP